MSIKPKLRPLDFQPVIYKDQRMWLVRDPLELTDLQVIFTPELAQLLMLFDGTLDVNQIQQVFLENIGEIIELDVIDEVIARLDEACLLKNERSGAKIENISDSFRLLPYRQPALAGLGYPADTPELSDYFQGFETGDDLNGWHPWQGRGIISPHIDYSRGGSTYSRVWRRAGQAIENTDLVLIFGTDHNGSPGKVTLTKKAYATPYGVIPTDPAIVDALSGSLGAGAFAEELHHRKEHSIELSAVWLHHIQHAEGDGDSNTRPMIPILCGSFQHYLAEGKHPQDDESIGNLVQTLRESTAGKRVLAVASVDLAHVGPNFGDNFVMDNKRRQRLWQSDKQLMEIIASGDADRFFDEIAAVGDQNRICGFSSIYLLLRYLGSASGQIVDYQQCPADPDNTSLVSICGILLE